MEDADEPPAATLKQKSSSQRLVKFRHRHRIAKHKHCGLTKDNHGTNRAQNIEALKQTLYKFRKLPSRSSYARHRIKVLQRALEQLTEGGEVEDVSSLIASFQKLEVNKKFDETEMSVD